ncbi:MAG: alaS [Parachlamydiales bacterium]|nr:alaS [Parachlamydiales bacterium]
MLSQDLRRQFLQYFKSQGHTIVSSSPVVPLDDPTLLFTNAGMNQFKDVFLGQSKRPYTRAATTQKCIRVGGKHNDLENVGHTSRHCTFFEMLGNFSFGDYFKKEAIGFAWDVATQVFAFDPKKIWVSVFKDDDEALALWEKHIPTDRIVRFGEKENFWAMGDTGPCGPCSELLYDRGEKYGAARNPYEDESGERFLEFWNLVFMQFMRDASGKMDKLPKQSIDTGAGLERVVALRMHVDNVFLTDILRSLIARVEEISHVKYVETNRALAPAFHVIADHIRSLSFAIADGAQPSNTDRGYVLRKILRRAVRYGRMLGLQKPFLADVLPRLVANMGEDFPELKASEARINEILTIEEEAFLRTLQRGGELLSSVMARSQSSKMIAGDDAFKLKDTYGFPLEEIQLIAKDEGLKVDLARFEKLEVEAREKSRQARKVSSQQFDQNFFADFTRTHQPCQFVGYDKLSAEARIVGIVKDNRFTDEMQEGEEATLLLDTTPFYAEMGGQVGDKGQIAKGINLFFVEDCISPFPGVIAHIGRMGPGVLRKGDHIQAQVEALRRQSIQNNHTATHLLHWALQKVLGTHIKQAGSLVDDHHLRFDFNHHKPMSQTEVREVENLVNEKIRENRVVHAHEMALEDVQKHPDIKQFFGEKYGERVRVVDIEFSKELCGGTHTGMIGSIGLFKIAKESSIAAGVRRIEAMTGRAAEEMVQQQEDLLLQIAASLKSPVASASEKLSSLLDENKQLCAEIKNMRKCQMKDLAVQLRSSLEKAGRVPLIAAIVPVLPEDLALLAQELMDHLKSGVIAIGVIHGEKCQLLVQISSDLSPKLSAQNLIKEASMLIQGGGGGKPNLAQAGGKDPQGLPKALNRIREILEAFA